MGRGCIVGPVIAAAVILDAENPITGLGDSKKLSDKKRRILADEIRKKALSWSLGRAEANEIDRINILQASLLAMKRAFSGLDIQADYVRVDGKFYPQIAYPGETVIQGDQIHAEISAASILAKVSRDDEMIVLDKLYPDYGLAAHKGYPTRLHIQQLQLKGITPHYRQSFAPVRKIIQQGQ